MTYKPEHKHYLIKLPNGRFLCYPNTRRAIIYRNTDTNTMALDIASTNGELVAMTPEQETEIYLGVKYSNEREVVSADELREELIGLSKGGSTFAD